MKTIFRTVLDIVWYLVLFVLIQLIAMKVVNLGTLLVHGMDFHEALRHVAKHAMLSTKTVILSSGLSSALTMLIFGGFKWVPLSRSYAFKNLPIRFGYVHFVRQEDLLKITVFGHVCVCKIVCHAFLPMHFVRITEQK